jgi:predicted CXXCH cytochrome family protein
MKNILPRFLVVGVAGIALALMVQLGGANATSPQQAPTAPPIPHSLNNYGDCLLCHTTGIAGAPQYPADHQGRTSDTCQGCHKLSSEAAGVTATPNPDQGATPQAQPPAQGGGPPNIPHDLQGRDDCLACHQAGLGGAPKVPADHAGRPSTICRSCHQPAQPSGGEIPLVVPTPIAHPKASSPQDSCVSCHSNLGGDSAKVVSDWQNSIHSQRGVGCADCHGGDPTKATKEAAMSSAAGYVGKPNMVDIPALCGSCHARVEAMRQYDLPTDQFAQYQQSVHGKKLALGDPNVATCFTCHDGHGTKEVNDPSAKVYPLNVPALCASCHSDTQLMAPYGIPTNQYQLYQASVHGVALLQKQDLRAPTCATCHGTHGAAPPGFAEVANVCGSCHSATQDYYLKSQHASNAPGTPKCVTCHGRYDVMSPSEAMFTGDGARQCGSCHGANSAQAATVQEIDKDITEAAAAVDQADSAIQRAAGNALITAPEEVKLAEARTSLITSRAAQHTLDLKTVKENTDKADAKAKEIVADADKAAGDSLFRREFMGFGLAVMALAIGSLYVIRRELYKQLPKE